MFSLASKHNDPNAKLAWSERIGYGAGGFAFNMINGIIGSFLTIYFTSTVGLNAGIIATIFAVSKVFDGISDVIVGRMVDQTKSKLGKGRSWLLRMCIPFGVTTMLLFFVPQNFPSMAQYIYVFLLYNIVNAVCLTGMLVPYYSMISLVTANPYERGFLGNLQQIFQTLGNVVVNSTFVVLLAKFTDSTETIYTQRAFTITMLIYCIAMIIITIYSVFSTKERVNTTENTNSGNDAPAQKKGKEAGTIETVKALLKNKYWVIVTIASFVVFFVVIMYAMGNVYYCQYVLYDMGQYGWVSNSISIAQFAVMFVTPFFMKKFGKTRVYEMGMVVMGAGFLGFALLGGSNTIVMIVCNVLKGCGVGMAGGMALGMVADTIAYGTKISGIDTVGLGNAGVSAAQKIGLGLGTAVFGWVLNGAGYDGALDAQGIAQPESVTTAVNFLYNWLPFIMVMITFAILVLFYHCERDLKKMETAE
ncbi:MFS transporter [Firmicutes bacterium AM43-11BH]|nr:MFS transporter [Firmicutes bacterium AM43-11BH]